MTEHRETHFVQVGSWKTGLCQHMRRAFSTPHFSNYVFPLCSTIDVTDASTEAEYMDKETPIEVSEKIYAGENLSGVLSALSPKDPQCKDSTTLKPDVLPGKMIEESENTDTTRPEPVGDGTVYDQPHTNNYEDSEANDKVASVESENYDPKEDEITPSTTEHTQTHYVQVGSRNRRLCQYIRRVISSFNSCVNLFRQCTSVDVADSSTEVQHLDKKTPTEIDADENSTGVSPAQSPKEPQHEDSSNLKPGHHKDSPPHVVGDYGFTPQK
uniref:uncharacterized protein LOC123459461 n=1 Tax=Jaculus jaculus TaxID=51337 RepID=UPI001E1B235C|nr:uncharacterized protein LOC123459461 [Jaculus jaculus]